MSARCIDRPPRIQGGYAPALAVLPTTRMDDETYDSNPALVGAAGSPSETFGAAIIDRSIPSAASTTST
jgi:hypothetical protein